MASAIARAAWLCPVPMLAVKIINLRGLSDMAVPLFSTSPINYIIAGTGSVNFI